MADALTTLTKLLTVREIQEDADGAALHFQEVGRVRLVRSDGDYATHLRLARRSLERQHPLGVCIGEGQIVTELRRADNDVPSELLEDGPDRVRVFFQGHDGVFLLQTDLPESGRIYALLSEAIRRKGRVWFVAQKPDLTLVNVTAGWAPTVPGERGEGAPNGLAKPLL